MYACIREEGSKKSYKHGPRNKRQDQDIGRQEDGRETTDRKDEEREDGRLRAESLRNGLP